MTPVAAALLARVYAAGAILQVHGEKLRWRAPHQLPEDLLDALRVHKPELLAFLREADGPTAGRRHDLLSCVARSASKHELYGILADAEVAYVQGMLSAEDVDWVAGLCSEAASTLVPRDPQAGP